MDFDFTKQPGLALKQRNLVTDVKEPLVSIITPYYNAGKYFEQTFNCVLNQTFPWFEWIIADDGSSNRTDIDTLAFFASKDQRISVYHKENGGISTARNLAINYSTTDIIIPLDADDLIVPTYIETIYWALYFNPQYNWCYTNNIGFQNQEYLWDKPFNAEMLKTYNFLTYCGGIRKNDLIEVNCYDAITKHYYEDWRTWLKLLAAGKRPVKSSIYGFWYRRLDTGVLSIVNKDPQTQKLANQLIAEVAQNVDGTISAKDYPYVGEINHYRKPIVSEFNYKTFKSHDKLRIMMLIPWMEMGGADLFNLDVVRRIDKTKFEVSILTTVPSENSWRQRFEDYVTDIFELPSFLDIQNYPEFISYFIKSREVDVLFLTNSYYGYYLVPWLRKNFPDLAIVDYIHMEEWYWRNGGYARPSGAVGEILEKTYLCNNRTRQVMIRDFGRSENSVQTLYIGVDHEVFDANKVEAGIAKKQLGIAENRPCVLFPCRIHPQKRPFLMLEIANALRKTIPEIAFMVVGDGPQLHEMQLKSEDMGLSQTVYFAGRQNGMLPFYKDAALTLICSLKEGLALTAYESCSMSTPVVSSDVGGQGELVDSSVGALLPLLQSEAEALDARTFPQEEIEQYVTAISDILTDPVRYEILCKSCRQRIEERFSSKIMIKRLEQEFKYLATDSVLLEKRCAVSDKLRALGSFADDYVTIYNEVEVHEQGYREGYSSDMKNELMRLANTKWGSRAIKLAFRLKLNQFFK